MTWIILPEADKLDRQGKCEFDGIHINRAASFLQNPDPETVDILRNNEGSHFSPWIHNWDDMIPPGQPETDSESDVDEDGT